MLVLFSDPHVLPPPPPSIFHSLLIDLHMVFGFSARSDLFLSFHKHTELYSHLQFSFHM